MRYIFILISVLFARNNFSQAKKRALFIGNSYTYVNNLPQLVKDIALSKTDTLIFDQSTLGGATFYTHYNNPTTYSLIQSQNWDVVVLQGQSQEPSLAPATVMAYSYPYAGRLADSVRKYHPCCEVMYFMTWGRKNSDADNCPTYTPSCTYAGMQARLRESYLMFADSFNSACAPVGVAWKTMRTQYPQVELYDPDESHPGINGSYLAASVFYSSIFQKAVNGATYYATLTPSLATNIHQIATATVMDSVTKWNLNSKIPTAGFNYQFTSSNTVQFINTSVNGKDYNWSFASSQMNPTHIFASSPPYVVTLTVSNSCTSTTVTKTLTTNGIRDQEHCTLSFVRTNKDALAVTGCEGSADIEISILDLYGRVIQECVGCTSITTNSLTNGIYLLRSKVNGRIQVGKFIQ